MEIRLNANQGRVNENSKKKNYEAKWIWYNSYDLNL
jgi:hypothetical protein